jgi:hypothetical protein
MVWGAIAGGLASGVAGSLLGGKKSSRASRRAIKEQRRQYNQTRSDLSPYREAGVNALSQYQDQMGNPSPMYGEFQGGSGGSLAWYRNESEVSRHDYSDERLMCPLTGDDCMKHECEWYIHVIGSNPQSGEQIDKFGCSMSFIPMLLIENSQQQRETGAAVESFRNEMVDQNQQLLTASNLLGEH